MKKTYKILATAVLVMILIFSLCGCGGNAKDPIDSTASEKAAVEQNEGQSSTKPKENDQEEILMDEEMQNEDAADRNSDEDNLQAEKEEDSSLDENTADKRQEPDEQEEPIVQDSDAEMDNEDIEETVESEEGTNDVDPDLKAFLDSYEEFTDEYVEFMKKYNANPQNVSSMLVEYAEIMGKYEDFAKKLDQYNEEEMSTADAQYYLEVTSRCAQKMLDIYSE